MWRFRQIFRNIQNFNEFSTYVMYQTPPTRRAVVSTIHLHHCLNFHLRSRATRLPPDEINASETACGESNHN